MQLYFNRCVELFQQIAEFDPKDEIFYTAAMTYIYLSFNTEIFYKSILVQNIFKFTSMGSFPSKGLRCPQDLKGWRTMTVAA